MDMPGQRRLTRRFVSELQTKGFTESSASMFGSKGAAQPALESAPGSLAEQAAQMEQFGGFGRKSTEELFIQSFVETSTKVALSSPTAENLGVLQGAELEKFSRGDSEELFSSWLSAGYQNQITEDQTGVPPRTRPESRRVSSELAAIIKQQTNFNNNFTLSSIDPYQRVDSLDNAFMQARSFLDTERSFETDPKSRLRNGSNKQTNSATDVFESKVAQKIWDSPMPVTRSRSNELRRRAEIEATVQPQMNLITKLVSYKEPHAVAASNGWVTAGNPLALPLASDPSSSQPPPLNTSLSDYVGMLKGSLNKAKQRLGSQPGTNSGVADDAKGKKAQYQGVNGDFSISPPSILDSSSIRMKPNGSVSQWPHNTVEKVMQANVQNVAQRSIDQSCAQYSVPVTQISDSSGGAPNAGMGVGNDMLYTSRLENVMGRNKSLKRGIAQIEHVLAEPISMSDVDGQELQSSLKKQEILHKLPDTLTRMGSINSAARSGTPCRSPGPSLEIIDDATKKRRVDRHRKMTEAKGRVATSVAGPPDLQAALKRLDGLEKEVRSLRLNLSFMNRKDSDQTKKIEMLEEENKELKHKLQLAGI